MGESKLNFPNSILAGYLAHKNEIDKSLERVLYSGQYILGEEVKMFEQEFADYIGVRFGIGVGSGTDALHLSLSACDIGLGDEVITVSHTAVATVAAIEMVGAEPVLVDIDPKTYTMDPSQIDDAVTPRTKAIVPVHLYGHPADMNAIQSKAHDNDLYLIEDCAQSHGAICHGNKTGSCSDIGAFSFYPTKNLGALGDAGMAVTDNPNLAERLRALREYGWIRSRISETPGFNSRLDEMQAAILRVKLRYLDEDNSHRRNLAKLYDELLSPSCLVLPHERIDCSHVYHQYVVRSSKRDPLMTYLKSNGVDAQIHYPIPVHMQPAYRDRIGVEGLLPFTEKICQEILSLPIHPFLTCDHIISICELILSEKGRIC